MISKCFRMNTVDAHLYTILWLSCRYCIAFMVMPLISVSAFVWFLTIYGGLVSSDLFSGFLFDSFSFYTNNSLAFFSLLSGTRCIIITLTVEKTVTVGAKNAVTVEEMKRGAIRQHCHNAR